MHYKCSTLVGFFLNFSGSDEQPIANKGNNFLFLNSYKKKKCFCDHQMLQMINDKMWKHWF